MAGVDRDLFLGIMQNEIGKKNEIGESHLEFIKFKSSYKFHFEG